VESEGFAADFAADCDFAVLVSAPDQADPERSEAYALLERSGASDILIIADEESPQRGASDVA
jgi:hypothetical protein